MKKLKKYSQKLFSLCCMTLPAICIWACQSQAGKEEPYQEEVIFKSQDFPINSPLFAYEDSADLKKDMAALRLEPGLRIELVAAEPLVVDPVAFAFDEDQVLYVVENRGYPDPAEGGAPSHLGRIARLEDRDGDGRFDHRTEFANGLTYPNGILPWDGGVFVTSAPDIYYFKDTDGDGIADIQKVVLTGFNSDKTAQIRVSHPILGLDGWVYVTSGLNGGEVSSPVHPDRPAISFAAADGRFHPETYEFETTGGRSQFGLAFDAFGRRFGSSNRHPMQQIVMEPKYLRRNPHLLFNESTQNVAKAEAEAVVFPISNAVTSADFIPKLIGLSHKGTFTSACGLLVYQGSGLSHDHVGNAFICEPAQNLVQRQIVEPDGVAFKSRLPYENREFLSSTDTWFNPVFLGEGPDGALYLADMHRKVIDHPSYVPEEAREGLDFESGKDQGRLYRIVVEEFEQGNRKVDYPISSSTESPVLVAALASTEEWVRATAHRLLLQRKGGFEVQALEELAQIADLPESRVRALWLLRSLNKLNQEVLGQAMVDQHAGIREQAILLGESLWESNPTLMPLLIQASADEEMRVRFAAALMLGEIPHPDAGQALARIAAENGEDKWIRAAVLSGIANRLPEFLEMFRSSPSRNQDAFAAVMQDLGRLFGNAVSPQDIKKLFTDVIQDEGELSWRTATALGLVEGFSGRSKTVPSKQSPLQTLLGDTSEEVQGQLNAFVEDTRDMALNESESLRSRMNATTVLGYAPYEQGAEALQELLDARNAPEIQLAALEALARVDDARAGELLTSQKVWSQYTPRVKAAAIQALMSNPDFVQTLFSAIEKGTIGPAEISSTYRQRLLNDEDKKISEQAESLFKDLEGGGRMQVYQAYRDILELPAEASLGKAVFQTHCSACHTYAGEGGKVGPDLTGVNNQPSDALLLHTLVPNYEVLPSYQSVAIETNDERSLTGYLVSETDNSLTLRTAFGTEESVLRSNIQSVHHSGLSLMPDGLEQSMTKEELAHLIAYLKQGG